MTADRDPAQVDQPVPVFLSSNHRHSSLHSAGQVTAAIGQCLRVQARHICHATPKKKSPKPTASVTCMIPYLVVAAVPWLDPDPTVWAPY